MCKLPETAGKFPADSATHPGGNRTGPFRENACPCSGPWLLRGGISTGGVGMRIGQTTTRVLMIAGLVGLYLGLIVMRIAG